MSTYDPSIHDKLRPNVGVTVSAFVYDEGQLKVLTYKRPKNAEVFADKISLPNAPYRINEFDNSDDAATHALKEKANVSVPLIQKIDFFSGLHIDPERINTINLCYMALTRLSDLKELAGSDFESKWVPVEELLKKPASHFAFNHKEVLASAYERLKAWGEYTPYLANLLPREFTIPELQAITEEILGITLHKTRFRGRVEKSGILNTLEGQMKSTGGRGAQLYTLNQDSKIFYPRDITKDI